MECKAIYASLADADRIVNMVLDAAASVTDGPSGLVDVDSVKIEEKQGASADTELVPGTILDKPADGFDMPVSMEDARVLLLNDPPRGVPHQDRVVHIHIQAAGHGAVCSAGGRRRNGCGAVRGRLGRPGWSSPARG